MLCRQLDGVVVNEDEVENEDWTHFIINIESGKGLGFKGEE